MTGLLVATKQSQPRQINHLDTYDCDCEIGPLRHIHGHFSKCTQGDLLGIRPVDEPGEYANSPERDGNTKHPVNKHK